MPETQRATSRIFDKADERRREDMARFSVIAIILQNRIYENLNYDEWDWSWWLCRVIYQCLRASSNKNANYPVQSPKLPDWSKPGGALSVRISHTDLIKCVILNFIEFTMIGMMRFDAG
ncbi:MAG TPA: hypothetical protein DHV42_08160 [Lachnospiraceae bacterium]|nr:hypothetical protein [Lachnospiraceae bacterium]